MCAWPSGEALGLDFETTGVDRFNDVPVSYALVLVSGGVIVRSWSGLIDPGCDIPADASAVHGITSDRARAEGMPLAEAVGLVTDAVVTAGRRGVPLIGMKLDYDLTILDGLASRFFGETLAQRGWCGPVLDAGVIDRHLDPEREGRRTLSDLCAHYGIELASPHDATADTVAAIEVLFAMALRHEELWVGDLGRLHAAQMSWHRAWTERHEAWRVSQGMAALDPRDHVWPVAPASVPSSAAAA
jgi:DNA polymerase III subunit epsilon